MPRKDFVEVLQTIAEVHGLDFKAVSHDWIIQLRDTAAGRVCSVFGYTFDLNPAAAVEICKEKSATSLILSSHGIPHVIHEVFLNPAHPSTCDFVPKGGNWKTIQTLVQTWGFPVVLKPLKGSGGLGVTRCSCMREVEAAVQQTFDKDYGLAICPYKKVIDEYRCFHLDGVVELMYRKVRPSVLGDGNATVAELLGRALTAVKTEGKKALSLAHSAAELTAEELDRVPQAGESVPLQWKHNLGQGATLDFTVPEGQRERLTALAVKAAGAIGIRFCSVDIMEVEGEGLSVIEVNSGVMMDSLMGQLGEEGVSLARRLYETAVLRSLGRDSMCEPPGPKRQKSQ